jgi:E3 ubiquitin-protein ligase SHPRH
MISEGVSNAAVVARMIPRVNAWAISGTPVTSRKKNDLRDLRGVLNFLRYEPFASIKHVWSNLTSVHKSDFRTIFNTIALRHSKQHVKGELRLPAQRRYSKLIPVHFISVYSTSQYCKYHYLSNTYHHRKPQLQSSSLRAMSTLIPYS